MLFDIFKHSLYATICLILHLSGKVDDEEENYCMHFLRRKLLKSFTRLYSPSTDIQITDLKLQFCNYTRILAIINFECKCKVNG